MNVQCERESELLEAMQRQFVPADLVVHMESCSACAELQQIAGALLDDRAEAMAAAHVPSAGSMWWRIQLRKKQEAEAASRRSLFVGQAATLAVALLIGLAFFGVDLAIAVRHVFTSITLSVPLLLLFSISLVVAPLVGWVAVRQK